MTTSTINYRFKVRGGTAAALAALNEIPLERELVIETDTYKAKQGNGATAYNSLPYLSQPVLWAAATGTADALAADFNPNAVLTDGALVAVRASAANATTTPTLAPDGGTARTITKLGGTALVAGDISAAGHELLLRYRSSVPRWELLNPAATPATPVGTALTSAYIWVGNASNVAAAVAMSGDATMSNTGVLTLAASASQVYTRIDGNGDIRIDGNNDLRISS